MKNPGCCIEKDVDAEFDEIIRTCGDRPLTCKEISERCSLSRQRIHAIQQKAVQKIKNSKVLREYWEQL